VLEDLLIKYVGNHLWWKKVEALKGVVMPIICSMRITDTRSPNLHLAAKAYHDMKVQVSAAISEHPLITPGDRQIIMDVLEKCKKVCVSLPARAAAGANLPLPVYHSLFPGTMYVFICIYPNAEEWGQ